MINVAFFDRVTSERCWDKYLANNPKVIPGEVNLQMADECEDVFDNKNFRENFKNYYLFVSPKLSLPDESVLFFVQFMKDENITDLKIKVFVVEEICDDAEILIKWFNYLNKTFGFHFEVVSELSFEEFGEKTNEIVEELNDVSEIEITSKQTDSKNNVVIYTDGACSGNPGAGGWGAILMHDGRKKEISGFTTFTTNNIMELTAVIEALKMLKQPCNVELYSDSAYVVNAINQKWIDNWKKNGWLGSDKKPVKNEGLWKKLDELLTKHNVNFNKVKGHADNEFNNRCDELATGEIAKHQQEALETERIINHLKEE